ncbi:MAG: carbohydrate ABC transporter permease, partial [Betaproteobacteria bacterium]
MSRPRRLVVGNALAGVASFAVVAIALLPVLWGLSTSLKPASQILTFPPKWLPDPPTLTSYVQVWEQSNLPIYFRNSVIVTLAALVVALIVAVHCAYAMARFRFAGKNLVLVALLATSMIPGIAILVPLYDL